MYSAGAAEILGIVSLVWLAVLSFFVFRQSTFIKQLFPQSEERDIRNKFKEVIDAISDFEKKNELYEKRLLGFKKEGLFYIQRLNILRYNPYNDTGGDQSFSLALLDGRLSGVLLTSLHSRAGTRVYVKTIKSGKSDIDLSKEERVVLEKAINE